MSLTLKDLLVMESASDHGRTVTVTRGASIADLVEVLKDQGATTEVVGEPGYVEKDGWVEPGSYLVFRLVNT